jgi:aminoglycoside phosphotransferase (APT) family kinase protein
MHEGEVELDEELIARLVATQFPRLADLPIRAVSSTGTVNAIYRLGDRLYARLPRLAKWMGDLEKELDWLPTLAPCGGRQDNPGECSGARQAHEILVGRRAGYSTQL